MLFSVPDTEFGRALGQFLHLFEQRPLELARLHAAFAALAELAARDHPEMPWPMKLTNDRQAGTFTVEELLASMRKSHAGKPTTDEGTVAEKLALWNGAKVQDATSQGGPLPYIQLHFSTLSRNELGTAHSEPLGTLAVSCAWKLLQAQEIVCSSTDADPQSSQLVSKALKGARVLTAGLNPGGVMVLTFNRKLLLEVRPDDFSIADDYSIILSECILSHFDSRFTKQDFSFEEHDVPE